MSDKLDKILAMGLTPKDAADEVVRFTNYDRKTALHVSVKQTDTGLSDGGTLFRKTETSPQLNQVGCKVPIWIAKVSAVVTAGEPDGVTDKIIPAMFYLCKEETSSWAKQYLKFSSETENNKARLKSTASENSYSLTSYNNYIPKVVRDAADKYRTKFFNHHKRQNKKLTKAMITVTYSSFMCEAIAGEHPAITDHIEIVHGIEDGIETLSEFQVIQVDSKISFVIPSLLDIELLGPDIRKNKLDNVYIICVARDVIKKN